MAALKGGAYTTVPIESVISGNKFADVDSYYEKEDYLPKVKEFLGHPMFLK